MKKKDLPIQTQELLSQLDYVSAAARAGAKGEYNSASRVKLKAFIFATKDSYKLIHAITYNFQKNCFITHFYKEDYTWVNTEF
jgi:hypothetical protein